MSIPRPLTDRELATVLAALRYWQQDLAENPEPPISEEHFATVDPLTVEEIDTLCERLNAEQDTTACSASKTPPAIHPLYTAARTQAEAEDAAYLAVCPWCGVAAVQLVGFEATCEIPVTADGWTLDAGPCDTTEEAFRCRACTQTVPGEYVFLS